MVGYCRSIEMLSTVVEDSVREQGGEVSTTLVNYLLGCSLSIPCVNVAKELRLDSCVLEIVLVHACNLRSMFNVWATSFCARGNVPQIAYLCFENASNSSLTQCSKK